MLYRERPAIAVMFSYYHYYTWKNEYVTLFNVEGHNSWDLDYMELGKDAYPIWSQLSQVNGVTSHITNVFHFLKATYY